MRRRTIEEPAQFAKDTGSTLRLIRKEGDYATYLLSSCTLRNAATLSLSMGKVPTLAVEVVNVIENSTTIPNELIAHKIGLLIVNQKLLDDFIRRDIDEYPVITLNVTNDTNKSLPVTSFRMTPRSVLVDIGPVPILTMPPYTTLNLRGRLGVGTSEDHLKWNPVIKNYFYEVPGTDRMIPTERGDVLVYDLIYEVESVGGRDPEYLMEYARLLVDELGIKIKYDDKQVNTS